MSQSTRNTLLLYVMKHGEITTAKAKELCSSNYYHNGDKHVQESLTRLCNSGDLVRVSRGVYKKGAGSGKRYTPPPENQLDLFAD